MTFIVNTQVQSALAPLMAAMAAVAPPAGDVQARRQVIEPMVAQVAGVQPMPTDVTVTEHRAVTNDGTEILLRWHARHGTRPGPAVLYLHGGGMIMGSAELSEGLIARYVSDSGVPMLAADYRLAPEYPHPVPVEDCYTSLVWLAENAAELGIDPARIAVMGDSAGGGLAAAVALLTRDRSGPAVTRQILIYPMLDDRTSIPDPRIVQHATWTYDDNITGWHALLGAAAGGPDVPASAAPARLTDAAGLPAAYIEVGQLDIFCDEDLAYAQLLSRAGVDVEFHLHPGIPHAFDNLAYDTEVARRSRADRIRILASI
jgi:acetyl esterase/lipase